MTPRPDWQSTAENLGFTFHTMYGDTYWDESVAYAFSLEQIENDLEDPATELHALCLNAVDAVVQSDAWMARLGIPEGVRDLVAQSWRDREPSLYGRFDFAYTGEGPAKLLEYNADTPTSLYEAGAFQWLWLEEMLRKGTLPPGTDQFNSLHEAVVERFSRIADGARPMHFAACADVTEDRQTVRYLQELAEQAGIPSRYVDVEAIGIDDLDRFADAEGHVIERLFKLYPLEDMFREDFAQYLPSRQVQLIEPPWKALLSNKGLLPLLWEMYPGHPNLLPSYFEGDPRAGDLTSYVMKPLFSREGANIAIIEDGAMSEQSDGDYGEEGMILQALADMPMFDGMTPVLGLWVVGDTCCGLGMREDQGRITKDMSRFIPHFILPETL